ncbi:MAG: hypothetical protein ACW7DN_16550, partial [Paraglaciecola chathamensis]
LDKMFNIDKVVPKPTNPLKKSICPCIIVLVPSVSEVFSGISWVGYKPLSIRSASYQGVGISCIMIIENKAIAQLLRMLV